MIELGELRPRGGRVLGWPSVYDARAAYSVIRGRQILGVVFAHLGAGGGRWSAHTERGALVTNRALTREAAIERLLQRIDS